MRVGEPPPVLGSALFVSLKRTGYFGAKTAVGIRISRSTGGDMELTFLGTRGEIALRSGRLWGIARSLSRMAILDGGSSGRQSGPHARGREARLPTRRGGLDLRLVVDPPGDHPRHGRPGGTIRVPVHMTETARRVGTGASRGPTTLPRSREFRSSRTCADARAGACVARCPVR